MSQKTHPSSLRISSKYKNFYSCWYSDYFYSEMLPYDFEMRSYIESVCEQSTHLQCSIRLQNSYKRFFAFIFLLDTRGIRYSTEKALRLPSFSLRSRHLIRNSFLTVAKTENSRELLIPSKKRLHTKSDLNLTCLLSTQNQNFTEAQQSHINHFGVSLCELKKEIGFSSFKSQNGTNGKEKIEKNIANLVTPKLLHQSILSKEQNKQNLFFHSFLEKNFSRTHFNFSTVYPIRILQELQNADFLAGEIVYLLQKRVHFRQIQYFILRKTMENTCIKGIRISCSGRVGGRSKKAQKSKTQSVKWGQTSLHVFSSKLDFASKSASTLFGKVGVKVWLCYK